MHHLFIGDLASTHGGVGAGVLMVPLVGADAAGAMAGAEATAGADVATVAVGAITTTITVTKIIGELLL